MDVVAFSYDLPLPDLYRQEGKYPLALRSLSRSSYRQPISADLIIGCSP